MNHTQFLAILAFLSCEQLTIQANDQAMVPPASDSIPTAAPGTMILDHMPLRLKILLKLFQNEDLYREKYNLRLPRGILLTGKPGVGKTELARHIAEQYDMLFLPCSATSFVTQWQGSGEGAIKKLFDQARELASANGSRVIIFIDEIDAVASQRTNNGVANMGYEKALNELLTQMDGFEQSEDIIVIGATNLPDKLDNAIKRAGRFDYIVEIPEPTVEARKKIFTHFLSQFRSIDPKIKVDQLATKGFTPADIKNIVNQAVHEAAYFDAPLITQIHLERAARNVAAQNQQKKTNEQPKNWQDLMAKYGPAAASAAA